MLLNTPPWRDSYPRDAPPLFFIPLPQEFSDRRERLDVVAEDLEGREQRDGEEGARHAPDPVEEGEAREDRHRIEREPVSEQHRRDEVGLEQVDREEAAR